MIALHMHYLLIPNEILKQELYICNIPQDKMIWPRNVIFLNEKNLFLFIFWSNKKYYSIFRTWNILKWDWFSEIESLLLEI